MTNSEFHVSPLPSADSALSSRVELDPADWLWATWRAWQPLERPAVPAFDKADALRRLARVANDAYHWNWNWARAAIPPAPSREDRLPLSEVDPLVISETLSDLNVVMAKAR